MKRIYHYLALVAFFLAGVAGMRAQYYEPDPSCGENVQEIEEGVDYALHAADDPDFYISGKSSSSVILEESIFNFEKAGINSTGEQTWRIVNKAYGQYVQAPSFSDEFGYTSDSDEAIIVRAGLASYGWDTSDNQFVTTQNGGGRLLGHS